MKSHASMLCAAIAALAFGVTVARANSPVNHGSTEQTWDYQAQVGAIELGQVWVLVTFQGNPGEIVRTNPDGTLMLHTSSGKATVTVAILTWEGEIVDCYSGPGNITSTYTAIVAESGWIQPDGRREEVKIQGDLHLAVWPTL
jgi:hypothetical protein